MVLFLLCFGFDKCCTAPDTLMDLIFLFCFVFVLVSFFSLETGKKKKKVRLTQSTLGDLNISNCAQPDLRDKSLLASFMSFLLPLKHASARGAKRLAAAKFSQMEISIILCPESRELKKC